MEQNFKSLNGREVRYNKTETLKNIVKKMQTKPTLAIIMVGENNASQIYVKNKINYANKIGITTKLIALEASISEAELLKEIENNNNDNEVNGLFVQLPLPNHINEENVIKAIKPSKDVDGFTFGNIGKLTIDDKTGLFPCTVEGIIEILDYYNIPIKGQNITVVGRSNIVGKPMAMRLINLGATVVVCNSQTKNIKKNIENSDILISAIGKANYFDRSYFTNTKNLVIIDVGINRNQENKLCGDVDFHNITDSVAMATPVPGGVGLMTVVKVVENVIKATHIQKGETWH